MSRTNKEQLLFIIALVILGAAGYFRYKDQAKTNRVPSSKVYDWQPLERSPEVQFVGEEEERYSASGRNIFVPPRDWFPLQPLRLETPPGVELDPVWPLTRPALAEEHFGAYVHPITMKAGAPEELAGEGGEVLPDAAESAEEGGEGALATGTGSGVSIDLSEIEEEDPEAELMARFDWVVLKDRSQKIFGQILNEDKFALLDNRNEDDIRMRRYVDRTGKWAETYPYPRDRVADFGFARTVANDYELEKRDIIPNAANIVRMHELARWCLERRDEDPEAVNFAVEMARMAIEQDPLLGSSYLLLADIYETAFELEKELSVLREALDRGILESGLHVRYGRFMERYALYDEAVKSYQEGLRIRPGDAACLMALGELQLKRGDHSAALANCEEALRSPSLDASMKVPALLRKAQALLAINRLADAGQEVSRAINLDDENVEAWNLRGAIAFAGGDAGGALEAFQRSLEIEPENATAAANLGAVLLARGEAEKALENFEDAADLDPLFACVPLAGQGFAHELLGDSQRALDCYAGAVRVEPDNAYALYLMGRFQRRQGDPEEAIATLKRALRINGRIAAILGELGHACLDAGRYEDAAFYFREYSMRGMEDYKSLFLQGIVELKLENVAEATAFFERAADASNKDPEPLNGLALSCYIAGKAVEALDTFARVVRLFPEDSEDPDFRYALETRAAIESHLLKSQWVDRFQRKEIKNGWEVVQRYGPTVFLVQNEIHFKGLQRTGLGSEMTQLRREISGKAFRLLEAEVQAQEGNQGTMGIFAGSYFSRSGQGLQANAEIRLGVNSQGRLVYRVVDQGRLVEDWTEIEGQAFPEDEPIKFGIEVVDHQQGLVRLLVNDTPVVDNLSVKKYKNITRDLSIGVFGQCVGDRNLAFISRFVRIVKTAE
jgi:tetratricopeptide (TPR) repeat protein